MCLIVVMIFWPGRRGIGGPHLGVLWAAGDRKGEERECGGKFFLAP